jgi:hypothetical protein
MTRLLVPLLFLAPAVLAQGTLEVIPLRHRTVEQVLPVLRPLLEPGGAMSGQSYQLIDQPARRLLISVRFDRTQQAARSGVEAGARI